MMPDIATLRADGSGTPQRLEKILAALYYLLLHDEQVRDYHFAVDPADHHHILHDDFPKLTELNELLGLSLRYHFNSDIGQLTISNMSEALQFELRHLLVNQLRAGASMVNPIPWVVTTLEKTKLESEVASCAIAIFPSFSDAEPTPHTIITIEAVGDNVSKSVHAHVMTRNPALQTMISLHLGGLVRGTFTNEADRNRRIKRIGAKSVVVTCTRVENGIDIKTEPLSKEDGKIHVPVTADGKTVVAVKHTDILDVIRTLGTYVRLGAVPKQAAPKTRNPPNSGMQASLWPFPCPGITARAFGYRLGGVNHRVIGLRVPSFGRVSHGATGLLRAGPRAVNLGVAGLHVWGTLLGRLRR
ncbi:hypothetical protein QBC34DRAFT_436693 [Podospora aff. communis PSN243]|uniref:Uncharacterized protein n=1 Tax=Podospora aff. communis PSN243 TaxID=3040156 RepID=A0AAV9GTM2_9PEZI|nr:hypothetical protein QBC34DRAFT_436693 [Podospora aff. communis PSN243]